MQNLLYNMSRRKLGQNLYDLGLNKDVPNSIPKIQSTKEKKKQINWTSSKLRISAFQKRLLRQQKGKPLISRRCIPLMSEKGQLLSV